MKKITIKKNGIVTNGPVIDADEKAMDWLNHCLAKNKFGLPEREEVDLEGKPTGVILPAEFEVVIEDYETPVDEKRQRDYQREVDPFFHEAVMDFMAGKKEKSDALLSKYEAIKNRHPKEEK